MTHEELVERAAKWLRGTAKCTAVLTEFSSWNAATSPDALGWHKGQWSVMVEAKVSRSDFFADKKKPARMGQERWYITPPGLVRHDDLPRNWGLAYAYPSQVRRVVTPPASVFREGRRVINPLVSAREMPLLVSFLRRITLGEGLEPAFRSLFTGIDTPPVTYHVKTYGELAKTGWPNAETVVTRG